MVSRGLLCFYPHGCRIKVYFAFFSWRQLFQPLITLPLFTFCFCQPFLSDHIYTVFLPPSCYNGHPVSCVLSDIWYGPFDSRFTYITVGTTIRTHFCFPTAFRGRRTRWKSIAKLAPTFQVVSTSNPMNNWGFCFVWSGRIPHWNWLVRPPPEYCLWRLYAYVPLLASLCHSIFNVHYKLSQRPTGLDAIVHDETKFSM